MAQREPLGVSGANWAVIEFLTDGSRNPALEAKA
jgi:hypothetical protein